MAEAFGIAAGIVGLVSLSVQLTDSIRQFREIRHTYKDAQNEFDALVLRLDALGPVIEQSGTGGAQRTSADATQVQLLEDCKKRCQNVRESTADVSKSVLAEIKRKPWVGKIKAVFEKKTIEGWLEKLESAKSDLSFALEIFGR
jgi:hypothetical protein